MLFKRLIPKYTYKTLTPESYILNQRDSNFQKKSRTATLKPLQGCNHSEGSSDEVNLLGVPLTKSMPGPNQYDEISKLLEINHPDLIFLQLDPSPYIARQRFLAHKCALKEVEDYDKNGVYLIDPTKPLDWEECVVNLTVLDMLSKNQAHTEFKYVDTFNTYAYPYLQEDPEKTQKALMKPLINSISENIIYKNYSVYPDINKALYTALMSKQKVLLGDMPEQLLRLILGNTVEIQEMRDLFKFLLLKMKELKQPISMRDAAYTFLPHIFNLPRDLYITAMLKESFQACQQILGVVGVHHMNPIMQYWEGAPSGINYAEATRIPDRIRGETDEILIEKQAIMDVILSTRVWGEKYLANPFPYIEQDITKINDQEFQAMKKCFYLYTKKYQSFKNQLIKELPHYKNFQADKIQIGQSVSDIQDLYNNMKQQKINDILKISVQEQIQNPKEDQQKKIINQ